MAGFRRKKAPIVCEQQRKDIPDGMWTKCDGCGEIIHRKQLEQQLFTCAKCNFHFRIGSKEYIAILLDDGSFKEMDKKMRSTDPLKFTDTKAYRSRLDASIASTGLKDAIIVGDGTIERMPVIIASMEYGFIGGSMGVVVGEKITRAIERAIDRRCAVVIVCCSGGARMMEGALSLMQMAKICGALARLDRARLPYISVLTDPTTGGVTASFAMLGDMNIAEPKALIGFAGPRVIEQTIRQKLPEGFQRSEFLLEKGMLDLVVDRREMKAAIANALRFMGSIAEPLAVAPVVDVAETITTGTPVTETAETFATVSTNSRSDLS